MENKDEWIKVKELMDLIMVKRQTDGIILIENRRLITRLSKSNSIKKFRRDEFGVLQHLGDILERFYIDRFNAGCEEDLIELLISSWEESQHRLDELKLILEPIYHGSAGIKLSSKWKHENDWEYNKGQMQLTELDMINYKVFIDIFLNWSDGLGMGLLSMQNKYTLIQSKLKLYFVLSMVEYWIDSTADSSSWMKFDMFCNKFVFFQHIKALDFKNDVFLKSIVKFHNKCEHRMDYQQLLTRTIEKLDVLDCSDSIKRSMFRVETPQAVEMLSKIGNTREFDSILQYYKSNSWDETDFVRASSLIVKSMIPKFDLINERNLKSMVNLLIKSFESCKGLSDEFDMRLNYLWNFQLEFNSHFERDFVFHFSKFIIVQIKNIAKIKNRVEMENELKRFSSLIEYPILSIKSAKTIVHFNSLLRILHPQINQTMMYEYTEMEAYNQLNLTDCFEELMKSFGSGNTLKELFNNLKIAHDSFHMFQDTQIQSYRQLDDNSYNIICLKAGVDDEINTLPRLGDGIDLDVSIKNKIEQFIKWRKEKGQIYFDFKRWRMILDYGDDCTIQCNYYQYQILSKFNQYDQLRIEDFSLLIDLPNDELIAQLKVLFNSRVLLNSQGLMSVNEDIQGFIKVVK